MPMLQRLFFLLLTCSICFLWSAHSVFAALPGQLNLRHDYQMYTLSTKDKNLWADFEKTFYNGQEVLLSDADIANLPTTQIEKKLVHGVDRSYIAKFLTEDIAPKIHKTAENGSITLEDGKPKVHGHILRGEELNIPLSTKLIEYALKNKVDTVELAVDTLDPKIDIAPELKSIGITSILSIGESNFTTSSDDRIFNIKNAIKHFDGHIIKPDETFSFVDVLGPVDESTGYKQELVIKQDTTVPDWGGGICQVSSTLYRGAMLAGLPITERSNHTYAVTYYAPFGSDATVYPGSHDLKFVNNTGKAMMLAVFPEDPKLFFILLGTKNEKLPPVSIYGPYITDPIPAPDTKYLPSKKLAPGEKLLLTPAHNGLTSTWFRDTSWGVEKYVSRYQARPKVYKVGGLKESQVGILQDKDVVGVSSISLIKDVKVAMTGAVIRKK